MAITFVNKSAFASGTAALTVGAVASVVVDDLILLFVESANQAIATPTGFTQVTSSPVSTGTAGAAGGVRLAVFYRFATGADATTSVADTGDHTTAIKMAFRGVNKTTPFDATPTTGIKTPASTSSSFPTITTATANALIVLASGLDLDAASTTTTGTPTNANLTNLTERHDETVTAGAGGGLVVITGLKNTAGATGATTATVTSTIQVFLTAALREELNTGSLIATETGNDTFTSSGTILVKGTLSTSEVGNDTFSASGTVASASVSGSLLATEVGSDTFDATAKAIVKGSLLATEVGSDTFAATAKAIVKGSLSAAEVGSDTFAATAKALVQGALASTEVGSDTFTASGTVADAGIIGTLAATEVGSDVLAVSGKVFVIGDFAATELPDTFTSTGSVLVDGSFAAAEVGSDIFVGSGDNVVGGILAATEAGSDLFIGSGNIVVAGALAATEVGSDIFAAEGFSGVVVGELAATESGSDIFSAIGDTQVFIQGRARGAVFTPVSEVTVTVRPHKKVVGATATPNTRTSSSAQVMVSPHKAVSGKSREVRMFKGVSVNATLRGSKISSRAVVVSTGSIFNVAKTLGIATGTRNATIYTSVPTVVQFSRNKVRAGSLSTKVTTIQNPTDQELMAIAMMFRNQKIQQNSKFRAKM